MTRVSTLHLIYPEWQGYGLGSDVHAGATGLAAQWFHGIDALAIAAPLDEQLTVDDGVLGLASIAPRFTLALDAIRRISPDRILMAGGTCGAELAPVSYLNDRYAGDLAVLWLDAHADLNTPASSPSGHFHGMVLRTLLGDGPRALVDHLLRTLEPRQVFLVGARDLDPPEAEYAAAQRIPILGDDVFEQPSRLTTMLKANGFNRLYVHFDVDVLDPAKFGASLMRAPGGGPSLAEAGALIRILRAEFDVVGLSVLEVANASAETIQTLCLSLQTSAAYVR